MKKNYSYFGWTQRALLSAAAVCVAASAAHAQQTVAYRTDFDSPDTNNNVVGAAPYTVPYASPAGPVDPLDGQNGWGTNDGTQNTTNATQYVGRSNFVGALGYFTNQNAALGGVYRPTPANGPATAAQPDVIPSTTTGGLVTLFHPVTIAPTSPFVALNVDFAVTAPSVRANQDTFGLSLRNAANTPIVSFTFSPSTVNPTTQDRISVTTNAGTATPGDVIALNGQYHLALLLNTTTNVLTATIGNAGFTIAGVTGGLTVTQFVATWQIGDTATTANGGYTNADDNYLVFDNLLVPEPSTYAMMALGLVGLAAMLRLRRKQA